MTGNSRPSAHVPALDGVRGLAILPVLLAHLLLQMQPVSRLDRNALRLVEFGWLGVDLFFVL